MHLDALSLSLFYTVKLNIIIVYFLLFFVELGHWSALSVWWNDGDWFGFTGYNFRLGRHLTC